MHRFELLLDGRVLQSYRFKDGAYIVGRDPDVEVLRQRIGRDIRGRLSAALGPGVDPDVIDSLEMLYSGALVRAGMGYAAYEDIAARLEKSARLMLR